ncbi:hypothetical protein CLCR_09263 [Cladophialophora carrionii]|uniref:Uncharacterized protein n=1 Tax=Cladophialophora carrionii TaxID=86049 RepID=A0A1C1CUQ9_9EURO|nr:hypothetical protein CLCR_09263 [Cladophialophora carrionii]
MSGPTGHGSKVQPHRDRGTKTTGAVERRCPWWAEAERNNGDLTERPSRYHLALRGGGAQEQLSTHQAMMSASRYPLQKRPQQQLRQSASPPDGRERDKANTSKQ